MRGKLPIISYKDTWNLDSSVFIPVIVEALKKYRSIESDFKGTPSTFLMRTKNPGTAFDSTETDGITDHERWNKTIDFIISSLEAPEPEYEGDFNTLLSHWLKNEDGSRTIKQKQPEDDLLWDKYKKEIEIWDRNRHRAIELFATYFFDFWW